MTFRCLGNHCEYTTNSEQEIKDHIYYYEHIAYDIIEDKK